MEPTISVRDQLAEPKILQKIGKLRSSGMSISAIQKKLKEEDNINAGYLAVKSAYSVYSIRSREILEGDSQLKGEIKGAILDSKKQLKAINEIVWGVIADAQSSGELKVKAAREIIEHLKFQESLLQRMEEGLDFRKMNKVQMTQVIIENLTVLEKDGFIKILNKPREIIDLVKLKEFRDEDDGSGTSSEESAQVAPVTIINPEEIPEEDEPITE